MVFSGTNDGKRSKPKWLQLIEYIGWNEPFSSSGRTYESWHVQFFSSGLAWHISRKRCKQVNSVKFVLHFVSKIQFSLPIYNALLASLADLRTVCPCTVNYHYQQSVLLSMDSTTIWYFSNSPMGFLPRRKIKIASNECAALEPLTSQINMPETRW